jgi:hypothetical protein
MRPSASTAYHEAGHVVAAWWFGVPILKKGAHIRYTVLHTGPIHGEVHVSPRLGEKLEMYQRHASGRAKLRAERWAVVMLAGKAAQRKYSPRSVRPFHSMWDEFDAWDTFACFTWSDKETDLRLQVAEEKAKSFVNDSRAWRLIRAVANALLERKKLSRNEILDVIATERAKQIKRAA